MGDKKRIFKVKVVNFLLKHGAELLEVRTGKWKTTQKLAHFIC